MKKYFFIALILIIVVLAFRFGPGIIKYIKYNSEYNTALAYAKKLDGTTKTFELKRVITQPKPSLRDFISPSGIALPYMSQGFNIEGAPKLMYFYIYQDSKAYAGFFSPKQDEPFYYTGTFHYKIGEMGMIGYLDAKN